MKLFYVFSIDYQLISHRKEVVAAAIGRGYEVTVVAKDTGLRAEIEAMGVRYVDLPINRVGTKPWEELRTLAFLYRLYKKEKPDIVHHVSLKVVLWGGLAAKLAGVPTVVNAINGLGVFFESGETDSQTKRIVASIIAFSNKRPKSLTIFQNDEDRDFFVRKGMIELEQTRRINGSGVNLNVFRHVCPCRSIPLKVLFLSRMIEEKGVLDIIEASKILKPKYEGRIAFLLCGQIETNPKAVSEETLNRECDGKYLQYLGWRADARELIEESAVVLLPSYYREGIPKTLIEAAAVGRPIITTDWVGCKEVVDNGVNGFLIPIKSPAALAEKIELLVNNDELREYMGNESRKIAEAKFSIEEVIARHFDIYDELAPIE